MDPLKLPNLHITGNWSTFQPDMKGYIPPQELKLHAICDDIEDQIRQATSTDYMRDNDAPFIASSVVQSFPAAILKIRDETFTAPLSSREGAFLATYLGNAHASKQTVPGKEVKILTDTCDMAISKQLSNVLAKLEALTSEIATEKSLVSLEVFKAGCHQLSAAPANPAHFATIFVFLPSSTGSAKIRLHATHENVASKVEVPEDISQSVNAIGMYTGVSDARMEFGIGGEVICLVYHICGEQSDGTLERVPSLEYLSGASPLMRDAVCLWRHKLNSGAVAPALLLFFFDSSVHSADDLEDDDATLVCHLAPLAKAYRFRMYIGELVHTLSTELEVPHEYKEYDEEIDPSSLDIGNDPDVDYEWTIYTLGGVDVTNQQVPLSNLATGLVTQAGFLHDELMERDAEEDVQGIDDACYYSTVNYTHVRTASLLFIAP
ncbi:hypothetical protein C8R43DRAFT_452509 [Mycena crocata]|nr:hypothetical protein C8R43DRAFT_452509 [Mycena crocata]